MSYRTAAIAGVFSLIACAANASGLDHAGHVSPYAGEENRAIKSLSAADVDDLLNGRGWGLAKAAELNGMPGPTHVLEMGGEIDLTADQAAQIEALRQRMQADAIRIGTRLVELEAELDRAFASGSIGAEKLKQSLAEIEPARSELRYVHLAAHLETPSILTPHQVMAYNRLRGYSGSADPCANPPVGHDPAMWRKHNDCE